MTTFTAVVTTGIYCRPGYGGRPNPRNIRLFPLAASAEAAGFRACLRCRPYRLEPTPTGIGEELVCHAVRLVLDGVLDNGTEHDLGARLGISPRQLRRLFGEYLGLTPDQLARSVRAHFARRLLDDTDLPFAELAFAAGYGSVRQFNRDCLEIFRATPSELRARRRMHDRLTADGGLALRLPFDGPFDWDAMLGYQAAGAVAGVEDVSGGVYRRTVLVDGDPGVLELQPGGTDHLVLRAHLPHWGALVHLVRRARRIMNLDASTEQARRQLSTDPLVGGLAQMRPGIRPPGTWDALETGAGIIVSEQAAPREAAALMRRIVQRHGTPVPGLQALGLTHLFPTAAQLASARLEGLGLDAARIAALRALARIISSSGPGDLDRDEDTGPLLDSVAAASPVSPRATRRLAWRLGRADAFPGGDPRLLGSLTAVLGRGVTLAEAEHIAERWRPWRGHAAALLCVGGQGGPAAVPAAPDSQPLTLSRRALSRRTRGPGPPSRG
jgi:AraC family transcriptional regulator, regulatory protein of adaptative response / DNA-3-methyladenine glycosylase II